jgi:hypothetical protein
MVMGISLLGGCANAGGLYQQHGAVEMRGPTVRAFAVGPAVVHAYAPTAGGRIFTTDAVGSADAACASALAEGRDAVALPGDKVDELTVAAGKVACIAANTRGAYELVWHARADEPVTTQIAMAKRP